VKKEVTKSTVFYTGAVYKMTDVHGRVHHALCLDHCQEGNRKFGVFQLRGFPVEMVEEGTERANQFEMTYKPK